MFEYFCNREKETFDDEQNREFSTQTHTKKGEGSAEPPGDKASQVNSQYSPNSDHFHPIFLLNSLLIDLCGQRADEREGEGKRVANHT